MASADLPPELDSPSPSPSLPSDFPYEVFHSLPTSSLSSNTGDDFDFDCDYADDNLFFRGLSQRPTHSTSFSGVPTRRLSTPSSHYCDGFPVARKLSGSPKSVPGGNGNWSSLVGVSQLPLPIPSYTDRFDLVYAAAALKLARLKVAPVETRFGTCLHMGSAPFSLLPNQGSLPSSLNHDPFSIPCYAHSTLRRYEAVFLGQQRRQQIQAPIRGKKLGLAEGCRFRRTNSLPQPGRASKAGSDAACLCGNVSGPVRGCVGTGVFLPPLNPTRIQVVRRRRSLGPLSLSGH